MKSEEPQAARAGASTQDDSTKGPPRGNTPAWLADYLRGNFTVAAWQAAVVLGGIILAVHFLYIGFFPELDWQTSLALVGVIALTGLSVWVLICLLLTFPAFTWSIFIEDLATEPSSTAKSVVEQKWWKPSLLFGGPALFFWSLFALAVWLLPRFADAAPGTTLLALFAVTALTGVLAYKLFGGKDALGSGFRPLNWYRYLLAILAGSLVSFAPLFLIYALAYSKYNTSNMKPVTFAGSVVIGFLFNGAALQRWLAGDHTRGALAGFTGSLLVGAVLSLGLIAATGNWVVIPEGVTRLYGLGNIDGANLVLDKEGCDVAEALKLDYEQVQGTELCRLSGVKLLNRLGKTYYVEAKGTRFTLPGEMVKSDQLRP